MSIGSDLLSSITGNVETAILVIHDYREAAEELKNSTTGGMSTTNVLSTLNEARVRATAAALQTGEVPSYPGSRDLKFSVQFNPSKLTMNASAVPKSKSDAASGRSRSIAAEDPKLTMTVVLMFDDMDTYDSFMWEKYTSGLSAKGVANVAKGIMDVAGKGKVHSVQGEVEALISALRNPYTRSISFRWANFCFIGQLNAVQARYTMFSTTGRPVRAEVLLRIQHEMDPVMLQSWYKNFDTAFGGETGNLVTAGQQVTNLLNLSL